MSDVWLFLAFFFSFTDCVYNTARNLLVFVCYVLEPKHGLGCVAFGGINDASDVLWPNDDPPAPKMQVGFKLRHPNRLRRSDVKMSSGYGDDCRTTE